MKKNGGRRISAEIRLARCCPR